MLVLQPFLQPDLGLMMFKPGKTLLSELAKMSQGNRLVVMPLPDELVNVPSGKLNSPVFPESSKTSVVDERLLEFFLHHAVQKRLGSFTHWLERIPHCQLSDGEFCDKNLTCLAYEKGAVRLCWHHDNAERLQPSDKGKAVAKRNVLLWGAQAVRRQLHLPPGHAISLPEVCWWSVVNGVYECLPRTVLDEMFAVKQRAKKSGVVMRFESDERFELDSKSILAERVKSICLTVDDEPPAMFMARPKEITWHSEKYLKFVRSLPCVITGKTEGVVAHHLIGHGEGKMGGKTHDLFTMPLAADEHRRFHDDPKGWEARHASQLFYVKQTIKSALEVGVLK
ncbi:DUF968 domain-containing protein [Vibrio vulnificus]|nr:DUF968 domain-containing protein [Vibrio vulnificus]EIX4888995.1 DUF968 domain-containing protein [Vibrio vulnificus]ELV8603640.1 DUF968 domain-containing protein [Vibrio vulnificus]ELV8659164.1 DUF968 domain-containing protein [Vibrio vulnificus]HAS8144360.1 DUF968 domain-containing protein [Vibrio vulnificus]